MDVAIDINSPSGLVWTSSTRGHRMGAKVGCLRKDGYWRGGVAGKLVFIHRLVYEMHHGVTLNPTDVIDHINGVRSDNTPSNLRLSTHRGNQQNRIEHRAGALVGAQLDRRSGRWRARINQGGVVRDLGQFSSELMAHIAYCAAAGITPKGIT